MRICTSPAHKTHGDVVVVGGPVGEGGRGELCGGEDAQDGHQLLVRHRHLEPRNVSFDSNTAGKNVCVEL